MLEIGILFISSSLIAVGVVEALGFEWDGP